MDDGSDAGNASARPGQKRKKLLWNQKNTMRPPSVKKREPVELDYLKDIRVKRQERLAGSDLKEEDLPNRMHEWKGLQTNEQIDNLSKAQLLREKARAIEENAQRREIYLRNAGDEAADGEQVNDMLIDAIQAKVAILDAI